MLLSCLGLKGGSLWYIFVISIKDIKKKNQQKKSAKIYDLVFSWLMWLY